MSISYHGIVGYGSGKATLPSVETWGNNMNILRDPPRSITTRKIDKVGETSEITQMIEESGDRACEAINVYARGVNPMVAVSYDNYGNNGGQRKGGRSTSGLSTSGENSGKQAFLPYRIMDKGAFRPPIRDQRELLPLSRLPRVWTSSFTQPGFADFSKKAVCPGTDEDTRGVKKPNQMLKACVRPTATYQIETPITETYEVRNVIKNPIMISGNSGKKYRTQFNGEFGQPAKQVISQPLRPDINVNQVGDHIQDADLSHFDTERYTHEVLEGEIHSNRSKNVHVTAIEDVLNGVKIKEGFVIDYETPHSGYEKNDYIHGDIDLERALPYYESRTNSGLNIHKQSEHELEREYTVNRPTTVAETNKGRDVQTIDRISNRNYILKPTVHGGEFIGRANMPSVYHENNIQDFDSEKVRMRQRVYEMQQGRAGL